MLAYFFWHTVTATEREAYETGLLAYHHALAAEAPAGFAGSASYRLRPLPWLSTDEGYEDVYLLAGSWAIDILNGVAVRGALAAPHAEVARRTLRSAGGLYAFAGGAADLPPRRRVAWFDRRRGQDWGVLRPLVAAVPGAGLWRRQMVLSPAPEFALTLPESASPPSLPAGFGPALVVEGTRLGP
jgi:hypothetical protein